MAVFQREFNWSTYQDRQLKTLESIAKHIERSVDNSKKISDHITMLKISIESMVNSTKELDKTIKLLNGEKDNSREITKRANDKTEELTNNMNNLTNSTEKFINILDRSENTLSTVQRNTEATLDSMKESVTESSKAYDDAIENLKKISKEAYDELAKPEDSKRLAEEIEKIMDNSKDSAQALEDIINKARDTMNNLNETDPKKLEEKINKLLKHTQDKIDGLFARERDLADFKEKTVTSLKEYALRILNTLGEVADRFSESSNQLIYLSGASGDAVREFRSGIVDIVEDLNDSTGNFFNAERSFSQMVALSQNVTGDLKAIEDMAPALLLASETLNINTGSLAETFNKYYTRYNFSSRQMESLLDGILKNTSGNSAQAADVLENMKDLESLIMTYAKGDSEKIKFYGQQVANYTSWMESLSLSREDNKKITDWMKVIAYGDFSKNPELLGILERGGSDADKARNMFKEGQLGELTEILLKGLKASVTDTGILESPTMGPALDALVGGNRDMALQVSSLLTNGNFNPYKQFLEDVKNKEPNNMREAVKDKYVSAMDKMNNYLSKIASSVATIQEHLGIGAKELLGAAITVAGSWSRIKRLITRGGFSGTLGGLGSAAGGLATGAWGAIRGLGTKLAPIAGPIAGGLGGAYLSYEGISDALDSKKDTTSRILSAIQGGAGLVGTGGVLAGAGLLGSGALATALAPLAVPALAIGGAAFAGKKIYDYFQDDKEPERSIEEEKDTKRYNPDPMLTSENVGLKSYKPEIPDIESMKQEIAANREILEQMKQSDQESSANMIEEIQNIRKFLETWKIDKEKKDIISENRERYSAQSHFFRSYFNPQGT